MSDHLFLSASDSSPLICRVHPVVILSILDHHNRRKEGQYCVIGSLLGSVVDNVIEIKSSFGVPHSETEEELSVDMEYQKTMLNLHLKANPNEMLVGWYTSASIIDENSVTIHEFYSKEIEVANPVHLTVDSELFDDRMDIVPYIVEPLGSSDQSLGQQFYPIQYQLDTSDTEAGCLATLMKSKENENLKTKIATESENLEESLQKLLSMLDVASAYVNDVVEGSKEGDTEIGKILSSCVNSLPQIDSGDFEHLLDSSVQDKLTVVYLAEATRTQLALADRLQSS